VKGRSIFDGADAILSCADLLRQRNLPGFLVSLDFFHGFDRVSLQWVDLVLEAMGFSHTLREWVRVLHKGATATLMLHTLTKDINIIFSFRQGDPLAMVLFTIQREPVLVLLEGCLRGLWVGGVREASLGYVDNV
jgi:hypothetical protein